MLRVLAAQQGGRWVFCRFRIALSTFLERNLRNCMLPANSKTPVAGFMRSLFLHSATGAITTFNVDFPMRAA